jgi:hypothetical protein
MANLAVGWAQAGWQKTLLKYTRLRQTADRSIGREYRAADQRQKCGFCRRCDAAIANARERI